MSEIHPTDKTLLDTLKTQIAQKAGLTWVESWGQKDYEFLVFFIEEKSGVKISLTTIKRIWRNEYNRLPHIATLDALSRIACNKDWLTFKMEYAGLTDTAAFIPDNVKRSESVARRPSSNYIRLYAVIGITLVIALLVFRNRMLRPPVYEGGVRFSAKTSIDNSVPNSVVFTYNIDSVEAKKFYLQQSWDPRRRVEISKGNYQQTDIYYLPGYYMAKLIADDSVIKEIPVHIKTDNWVIAAHQQTIENRVLQPVDWVSKDIVGVKPEILINNKLNISEPFMLTFHNSRDFNIDGDSFTFSSDFRIDSTGLVCPAAALLLKGEYEYMYINLGARGCESDIKQRISNRKFDGKKTDLTAFGTNIYAWQNIRITNRNKKISLELNGKKIFETAYEKPMGTLKEIGYNFKGNGLIKATKISKPQVAL